jgi:superfamily I DNA/RNA helicase
MIPSDVEQFETEGERQFYRFLERVARPDNRYLSWYLPDIRGKTKISCHGPQPEIKQFTDTKAIVDYVAARVKALADEGMPLSEIAVLYTVKEPYENIKEPLPQLIGHALESKGILSNWISEDYKAKKSYDITTNRVTISTIQSAKGLDYACVFLLGLDSPKVEEWQAEVARNLTYVAITRAREWLYVPFAAGTDIIQSLMKIRQ